MLYRLLAWGTLILSLCASCAPQAQSAKDKKETTTTTTNQSGIPPKDWCGARGSSQPTTCRTMNGYTVCGTFKTSSDLVNEIIIEGKYYEQEVVADIPHLKLLADDFVIQRLENIGEITVLRKNFNKLLQMDLSSVGSVHIQE